MGTMQVSAALLAAATCAAANAGAITAEYVPVGTLDVGFSVGFNNGPGFNTKVGQSFLATTSGAFESLRLGDLYHSAAANVLQQALQIRIYDVTDTSGLTTGAPIGGWDVPASEIPADVFPLSPTFQYTGPTISIIAGRQYAFLIGTEVGVNVNFNAPYGLGGKFGNQFAGGSVVTLHSPSFPGSNSDIDIPFQVTVVVPSTSAVGAFGVFAMAGLARRRR